MPRIDVPEGRRLIKWPTEGFVTIYDLEMTCWEGSAKRNWSEDWEWCEIVQIGALKVNARTFDVVSEIDVLVKPKKNPEVSDYFTNLTGITKERVNKEGKSFAEALEILSFFVGDSQAISCGADGQVILENCLINDVKPPEFIGRCFNFAYLLADSLGLPRGEIVSSRLPKLAGIEINERAHNGLSDCRSIAAAFQKWRKDGII